MELAVCDVESEKCMLHHCDDCPDISVLKEFLHQRLLSRYTVDSTIKYKQWDTDRSQLIDNEDDF